MRLKAVCAGMAAVVFVLAGCASIPPEAPELSAQLGARITAVEVAHRQLLSDYFLAKKKRVDEFVQAEWVPQFARELFQDPRIAGTWDEVVKSNDPTDRLKFVLIAAPAIQQQINAKRTELMQPLEELQATIESRLKAEYDNMRAINSTLTAFLQSAAKLEQNRKRYLDIVGVSEEKIDGYIYEADQAVSSLVARARTAQDRATDAEEYRKKIQTLIGRIRKGN